MGSDAREFAAGAAAMIGAINLEPLPEGAPAQPLTGLPAPPALRWSGFVLGCGGAMSVPCATWWAERIRSVRPAVPIGLVLKEPVDVDGFQSVAETGIRFDVVLAGPSSSEPTLRQVIDRIAEVSVEGHLLERWMKAWPGLRSLWARDRDLVTALVSHAARGGTLRSLWKLTHLSQATVARRLRAAQCPAPGFLLRDGRLASVAIRRAFGVATAEAAAAAGWLSPKGYYEARRRHSDALATHGR